MYNVQAAETKLQKNISVRLHCIYSLKLIFNLFCLCMLEHEFLMSILAGDDDDDG